jgi:hypothetical protein
MARPEPAEPSAPYIEALLNYLNSSGEKPASYGGVSQDVADRMRKGKYEEHRMKIYNARAIADQLSLEREGFILVNHETQMKDFYDEDEVRSRYYKETEELVKQTAGARRVLVFDHTLRSADQATREENKSAARCATRTTTTRNGRDRSASAIYFRMRPKNFSSIGLPWYRRGARSTNPCGASRSLSLMGAVSE